MLYYTFANAAQSCQTTVDTENSYEKRGSKMKKDIHPSYGPATVTCACGKVWEIKSTRKEYKVGICAECHPFFTGKQKLVDIAGRVEKFRRRYDKAAIKK